MFGFCGAAVGLLISLVFGNAVARQKIREGVRKLSFAIGFAWGNLGVIIGVVGLIAWVIKLVL